MAEDYAIANISVALAQRLYPTVTTWNRLEGRPRRPDFSRALKAEVRDAMFMLSRQWQLGEFRADDAGSPATVKMQLSSTRLRSYQNPGGATLPFDDALPLEARVERRALPLTMEARPMSLDIRLLLGRQWLKMLATIADYSVAFLEKYPITAPDPSRKEDAYVCAHREAWQVVAALAGRRMDGGALYTYLTEAPGRHAWHGIAAILPAHRSAIDTVAASFVSWVKTTFTQPPSAAEDAWQPERLEYQFACAAPDGAGETVFDAEEYYHGHLDWYNLDIDPSRQTLGTIAAPATPQTTVLQSLIPVPIAYEGMPNTRWWTFEDRRVNFGAVTPATTDLGLLAFLEFGLVYANDWFLIPLTVDAASVVRVRGMAVTTVFGERFWITAAGAGADDQWQRWSMFTLSTKGENPRQAADTSLLLLPAAIKVQEGPTLEEVVMIRDEVANMVWGVERTIPLPTGRGKRGAEAAVETLGYHRRLVEEWQRAHAAVSTEPTPAAPIVYKVMNAVPEQWIPFISVHIPGDTRETQLQRASVPRLIDGDPDLVPARIRPRTMLMRDGLESTPKERYIVHEEEVPRAGVIVSQAYQRARWTDGRVCVWLGAKKEAGRGEGSSGLTFDRLANVPQEPTS